MVRAGTILLIMFSAAAELCSPATPAGSRQALIKPDSAVLPGGRVIAPSGVQLPVGSNPLGISVNSTGNLVGVTARSARADRIVLFRAGEGDWHAQMLPAAPRSGAPDSEWRSVSTGLVFWNERTAFVSEGAAGRVSLLDFSNGRRRTINLAENGEASFAGELVLDAKGGFLYAADEGRSRVVVIEARSRRVIGSTEVGGRPVAMALSPDFTRLYVVAAGDRPASLHMVDVSDPSSPKASGAVGIGGVMPSGLVATAEAVYVSNTVSDSVLEFDTGAAKLRAEIPIRIPGMERLRGVLPLGLAADERSGRLFVAEAGINAIGVIDTRQRAVLGHIPAGWRPSRVAIHHDTLFTLNAQGMGSGPNSEAAAREAETLGLDRFQEGSVSISKMPDAAELARQTQFVLDANGVSPAARAKEDPIPEIESVVLILKGGRTFDDLFGDIDRTGNGPVMGEPVIARLGSHGYADGRGERLSIKDVNVTPNHHAIARSWSFSDNFYADDTNWDRLVDELRAAGKPVLSIGEPAAKSASPDQRRASELIRLLSEQYEKPGRALPRFILVRLPNSRMFDPRPEAGYPYPESYAADNDLALGRILEYLSGTVYWRGMAVFVTEETPIEGLDHLDRRRTPLLCAGPWARKHYVSHLNSGFSALRATILRLAGAAPSMLWDDGAGVEDCLTGKPDVAPYRFVDVDHRLFDPQRASASGQAP